ncbi:hypothetical protein [Catenuloplanes japonicus]|uniref:hypothetical protein n=1 Tax=Catenuloplanes japonicus TaxID=33876 RepID=UPI0005275B3B|nr:hypothetical protein [Catenuloplanes japonicus]
MSSTAEIAVIDREDLAWFLADPGGTIDRRGQDFPDPYPWSGIAARTVLTLLDAHGIDLDPGPLPKVVSIAARDDIIRVLVPAHRRHLDALHPDEFTDREITRAFEHWHADTERLAAVPAAHDTVTRIRALLARIADDQVGVIWIT